MVKINSDELFIIVLLTSIPMFAFWIVAWINNDIHLLIACYFMATWFQFIIYFAILLMKRYE